MLVKLMIHKKKNFRVSTQLKLDFSFFQTKMFVFIRKVKLNVILSGLLFHKFRTIIHAPMKIIEYTL